MRVDIDDTGLQDILNRFPERENKRTITNAINKSITNVNKEVAKKAGEKLDIVKTNGVTKAKLIKSHIGKIKANYTTLSGVFWSKGKPLSLIYFRHKKTEEGMEVRVKKGGSIKLVKHAFVAQLRDQSEPGIYWRKYSWGRPVKSISYADLPLKYRGPLVKRWGPRIEDVLAAEWPEIQRFAMDRLTVNLQAEINRTLRGF